MIELPPPTLITSFYQLNALARDLANEPLLALDTEGNSLHAYQEQVCLIQLSTRTQDYLIDPLAIDNLLPLGELLENPNIEKVLHDASYDVMGLKRDFDFEINNLFDTMYAARILGVQKFGLAKLIKKHFGVKIDKRFQRSVWHQRPLTDEQIRYAQMDTHFLPALRDILYERLMKDDAIEEAEEIFAEIAAAEPPPIEFDEEGYWQIGRKHHLSYLQMAMLRELYLWRENVARQNDLPRGRILSDDKLVDAVRCNPSSLSDIDRYDILRGRAIRDYGKDLIMALRRGRSARLPKPPRRRSVDQAIINRHDRLRQWRKARAIERGVESDIIMPPDTLWQLAKKAPNTLEELKNISKLGPWRRETYGQEIISLFANQSGE